MEVFNHHIYEYEKGLRNLILHTASIDDREFIERKLEKRKIPYLIQQISPERMNVFFGHKCCIDVVKSINKVRLNEYTDEEDFILGTMLGYDRLLQCRRFLKRKSQHEAVEELIG
jgi:hypothetical protein